MKTIVLTGGGTAGHVTPNLALIPELKSKGFNVVYIGTEKGMERELVEKTGIPYYYVSTGKLRRYMSKDNFTDVFKVAKGIIEAKKLIKKINAVLRDILPELVKKYNVAHICGKGNVDGSINIDGYKQFEYVSEELPHIMAAADMIISRAGSNSISEFLALKKPALLIPLSARASRGDQILNAKSFQKQGYALVLDEDDMNGKTLMESVEKLYNLRPKLIEAMKKSPASKGTENVLKVILEYS